MKNISEDLFGDLYDKIRDRVEQTGGSFSGFGVEGSVQQLLEKLWKHGKYWGSIALLVCYHYTRSDAAILKISRESYYFRKGVVVREIAKSLGVTITGLNMHITLEYSDFLEMYAKYDTELPILPTGKFKIGTWLEEKGINPGGSGHFCRLWKNRERKKFITLLVLYENSRIEDLDVELGENTISIRKNSNPFAILEKIEEVEF